MTNLVIVMAGDNSLHETYSADRDFELWVCHWGDDDGAASRYESSCDRFFRIKGQKWDLVRKLGPIARKQGLPAFSSYDFVFLPDDDIEFPAGAADISRAFALAGEIGADIFQPAIANEYFSWEPTRQIEGINSHASTIVEIMMPAYSGDIFERCVLPLLHVHCHITAGWGIEPLVCRLAETILDRPVRTFVLDAVPAIHTRPVGKGSAAYDAGKDEAFLNPLARALPMQELARFQTPGEATRYAFPPSDDCLSWKTLDKQLRRVSGARVIHDIARKKNLSGLILNGLQKLAARGNRQ